MTLYANVRLDSRYSGQRQEQPFPVGPHLDTGYMLQGFFWQGGPGGQYRTSDLDFYRMNERQGCAGEFLPVSPLDGDEPTLVKRLSEIALTASNQSYMENYIAELSTALKNAKQHLKTLQEESEE